MWKDQQTIKFFDNLYRKSLQDNLTDKSEFESQLLNKLMKQKMNRFYKFEYKKLNFFSHNKWKFNLEPKK